MKKWMIVFPVMYLLFIGGIYAQTTSPHLFILGAMQDGGSPHIGCTKSCCKEIDPKKKVVSIGLIDPSSKKNYLFESTPDVVSQIRMLNEHAGIPFNIMPNGIFITHAHIGHYSGLMQFGREALGGKSIPVYAMPRMKTFLENNGPWSQLVTLKNIELHEIKNQETIKLSDQISVKAIKVPHRDEFSETVGYIIEGPTKKALFIPDIDKWEKWEMSTVEVIKQVDYAFIDGTFYDTKELNNRKMSEVPHPLVSESMQLFNTLLPEEKNKIWFIHLNHTNPLLNKNSEQYKELMQNGFHVVELGNTYSL